MFIISYFLNKSNFSFYFIAITFLPSIFAPERILVDTTLGEESADDVPDKEKALVLIEFYTLLSLPLCYAFNKYTEKFLYTAFRQEFPYHFCPAPEPILGSEDCLFPGDGEQVIKCQLPVTPTIKKHMYDDDPKKVVPCANEKGALYSFTFQPCMKKKRDEIKRLPPIKMYEICYNEAEENVIYIYHKLLSPTLLTNELLETERQQTYKMSSYDYGNFKNRFEKSRTFYEENSSEYTMKFVVSPNDMAFSVWKRVNYHYINTIPVLPTTKKLLEHIEEYIRTQANSHLGEVKITDGFRDFNSDVPAIWIKFIYSESKNSGIAVVIHNTRDSPLEKLCQESICDKYKWEGLIPKDMKSHAYCCEVNHLAKEFGIRKVNSPLNLKRGWRKFFKTFYYRYQYNCPYKEFTFLKYI